jgi:signal transduction histidine kinase
MEGARCRSSVHADLCDEPAVPFEVKEALYRIAQEALNNVAKHAYATHVTLRLTVSSAGAPGGTLVLEVQDDGVGFDPQRGYPGHLGLQSMEERAARAGGTLAVDSAPARGTMLRVRIPPPQLEAGL